MKNKLQHIGWIVLSAILTGISIHQINFWLIWIALVPFFIVLLRLSKKSVLYGGLFGSIIGGILLSWIIEGTARFAGTDTWIGIPIFFVGILYYAIYTAVFSFIFVHFIRRQSNKKYKLVTFVVISAFLWILFEWGRLKLLPGVPWLNYTLGCSQFRCLYGIQLASIAGQWGISFIILIVNLLLAMAIKQKRITYAIPAVVFVILFYLSGAIIFHMNDKEKGDKIKIAILQENIKAETRWNESNGDLIAERFFNLNRQAAANNPDIIIWSETAVPWTYRPDDDLFDSVLRITKESNAFHILGILSDSESYPEKVYNSVYSINPNGEIASRYDKINLLSFIESPLINEEFKIPFLSEGVFTDILKGATFEPLITDYGKLGVLICNESLSPYEAKKLTTNGAEIFLNISNDAWIENTYLVDHHFYAARARAVENRKDIIVNSNRGYSGCISSSGEIIIQNKSDDPKCIIGHVSMNQEKSFYFKYGDWLVYLGMISIFFVFILKVLKFSKVEPPNSASLKQGNCA